MARRPIAASTAYATANPIAKHPSFARSVVRNTTDAPTSRNHQTSTTRPLTAPSTVVSATVARTMPTTTILATRSRPGRDLRPGLGADARHVLAYDRRRTEPDEEPEPCEADG